VGQCLIAHQIHLFAVSQSGGQR